jgi:hypothetical protein
LRRPPGRRWRHDLAETEPGRGPANLVLARPLVAGQHFLLDTGTLCVLGYYREVPAVEVWNGSVPARADWQLKACYSGEDTQHE